MITDRAEVMRRAGSFWPMWTVPYSMSTLRGGYRTDCSGYVSGVYGIPASGDGLWGGASTVQLPRWFDEISPDDLQSGDIVGCLGPGTEGAAGHVVIFDRWLNSDPDDSRYYCYEQSGDGPGPRRSLRTYGYDGLPGFRAYRARGMGGGGMDLDYTGGWARPALVGDRPARVELDDVWAGEHGKAAYGQLSERTKLLARLDEGVKQLIERPAGGTVELTPEAEARIIEGVSARILAALVEAARHLVPPT